MSLWRANGKEFHRKIKDSTAIGQDQIAESEPSVDFSMDSKWYGIQMANQGFGGQGQDQFAESDPSVDLSMESKWYGFLKYHTT